MQFRLFAAAAVAVAVMLTSNPLARADDAGKKKAKKKGPDLEAIFKKLDADNDGKISATEFTNVLQELHKKKDNAQPKNPAKAAKKAELLFTKLDADKNGSLSLDEFKTIVAVMKEMKHKKNK